MDQPQTKRSLWQSLPALLRALILGGLVGAAGTMVWLILVSANLQRDPAVPWSVAAMAFYLVIYWWFLRGGIVPWAATRRRELLRVEPLPASGWNWALLALVLGFLAAFVFLIGIQARIAEVPAGAFPATGNTPWYAVVSYIAMVGIVAGVAEEAAYRGYMQVELERAYGPAAAIVLSSIIFALAHFSVPLLPFVTAVGALLGTVAYLARSIVPGLVVHGVYDFLVTLMIWQFGYPQMPKLGLSQGIDEPFLIAATLAGLAATGSVWAMTNLARQSRTA
ncbi:MAG: CPBP family intramembrane metalloprotease [Alphaproteobacteria bacterium]|nr:CPBP family intramembrane metalloprotease [Alphaproteobacteria bacterium]